MKRILHYRSTRAWPSIAMALAEDLGLEPAQCANLLSIGAIYIDKKRAPVEQTLEPNQVVRLHLEPKRFSSVPPKILVLTDQFVVVQKEQGQPTHATLDNAIENALSLTEQKLGESLFVTHRLDQFTTGLLILARNPTWQKAFNHCLMRGLVDKTYLAICKSAPPLGPVVHFMAPDKTAPKVVSPMAQPGWRRCELVVEEVRPHDHMNFICRIKLVTGRTHQIRAQLAALNCPIVGDPLYGNPAGGQISPTPFNGLTSQRFQFPPELGHPHIIDLADFR